MLIWIFFCPQIALIEPLLILNCHDSNASACPGIASGMLQQNHQMCKYETANSRQNDISPQLIVYPQFHSKWTERPRAPISHLHPSLTLLCSTSFKCSLLTLRLGIPLENCGAFPPSVTSQPSLKHLVHHSYTFTTCKIKQAMWPFYKVHNTFMSHLDSTDPWVPHRPVRPW